MEVGYKISIGDIGVKIYLQNVEFYSCPGKSTFECKTKSKVVGCRK